MWSAVIRRRRVKGMTLSPSFGRYAGTLNAPKPTPGTGGTKPPPVLIACARLASSVGRDGGGSTGAPPLETGGSVRGGAFAIKDQARLSSDVTRRTSSRPIRPCSPEPWIVPRSSPCSSASRRAPGDARGEVGGDARATPAGARGASISATAPSPFKVGDEGGGRAGVAVAAAAAVAPSSIWQSG